MVVQPAFSSSLAHVNTPVLPYRRLSALSPWKQALPDCLQPGHPLGCSQSSRSTASLCGSLNHCDERQKIQGTWEFWSRLPPVPSGWLQSPSASDFHRHTEVRHVQNEVANKLERPVRTQKGCQYIQLFPHKWHFTCKMNCQRQNSLLFQWFHSTPSNSPSQQAKVFCSGALERKSGLTSRATAWIID